MKNKICTSQEQSNRLIELGIDVNTADMFYDVNHEGIRGIPEVGKPLFDGIPAWSFLTLLSLMPKIIFVNNRTCGLIIEISPHTIKDDFSTKITYFCYKTGASHGHIITNNPLDAAFEMICWLLQNKKI